MHSELETHLSHLHGLLAPRPGALAVDVGCGDGSSTRALSAAGWRALGLEVSPHLVERARAAGQEVSGVSFSEGRGEALPANASRAALIIYLFSFHHVPEDLRVRAVTEAKRSILPDGRLHIVDPLPEGPMSEVVLPVEDERATRRHAHQLLQSLDGLGWKLLSREEYVIGRVVSDFQTIVDDLLRMNSLQEAEVTAMRPEMERRFKTLGVPVKSGRRLDQPCVAYHFKPV